MRDRHIRELAQQVEELTGQIAALREEKDRTREVNTLRRQINDLTIDKSKIEEANARDRREVEHSIGLERKRVEAEREQAVIDAKLAVREENLEAQKQTRYPAGTTPRSRTVPHVREADAVPKLMDRMPTVNVDRQITEGPRRRSRDAD